MSKELSIPTQRGQLFAKIWSPEATRFPPIILMHDSLGCVALWRDFPARLAEHTERQVIAYDRLGFGQSDPHPSTLTPPNFITEESTGDFRLVIDHLRVRDFVILGHSVGGGMGLGIAATHPARCEALITIAAQTFAEQRTLDGVRAAKQFFAQPEQRERLSKYHSDKTDWVLDAWIESWLSPGFANWTLDPQIQATTCPILAIHGAEDEYGSTAHPQRIKNNANSYVTLSILDGEGHTPHRSSEETVLQSITSFLVSN